jgi:hypothetical protein
VLALLLAPRPAERARRTRWALDAAGVVALAGTALAWARLDGASYVLYRGGFWLTELLALVLIACAMEGRASLVARLLGVRPLRLLGVVSYGAYLWHWPVHLYLTSARARIHGPLLEVVRLAATLGIATLSYRYLEKPIRERRIALTRPVGLLAASAVGLVLVLAGATFARPAEGRPGPLVAAPRGNAPVRIRIAVHGDSTANSLGWVMVTVGDPAVAVVMHGHDGFSLVRDAPPAWPANDADVTVVFLGGAFLHGIDYNRAWRNACHPEWDRRFERGLEQWLAAASDRARQLWVATVPYPLEQFDTPEYRAWVDCINRSIRSVTAAHPGVRLFELAELLCPGGVCRRDSSEGVLRPDGVHYDPGTARELGAAIIRALERGR